MRWVVVVNRLSEVSAAQTTWLLAAGAAQRDVEVWLAGVDQLEVRVDARIGARAVRLRHSGDTWQDAKTLEATRSQAQERIVLDDVDLVLIRTSPARDNRGWAHAHALRVLGMLARRGVPVLNDPGGLQRAASKAWLAALPEHCYPRTYVGRDLAAIREQIAAFPSGAVLKPTIGTRGSGVFRVRSASDENLGQLVELLGATGMIVVQEFVPEATDGDVRLILMEGEPLTIDGAVAAVRRVPPPGDFRSNVFSGGVPEAAVPTAAQLATARAAGPALRQEGLFLVGLDLIGPRAVEVNVFSTGGIGDAEKFSGKAFTAAIIARLMAIAAA